jgi:hypothetical protein
MKKNKYLTIIAGVALASLTLSSCVGDLNQTPLDPKVTTASVTFSNQSLPYIQFLAKIYAGFSTGGIVGGDASVDITGYDGGSQAGYIRPLWNMEVLPTDEAICCWQSDGTLLNFHPLNWTATNPYINGFYSRLYYQITIATAFLQETTAAQLTARGCSASLTDSINTFRAEARFLRAMCYANILDLFRNGPYVDDNSSLGTSTLPPYATAQQLFNFVVSELNDCQTSLLPATVGYNSSTYGHVNQAAAWSLLARLYLNADTYLGTTGTTQYYTNCITNCNKVIAAGYSLEPTYQNLFLTDNYQSNEIILPNIYDGTKLETWGGLTFLESSAVNSTIQSITNAPGDWAGNRTLPEFLARFTSEESNYTLDTRYAMLYQGFNHPSVDDNTQFTQGTPVLKFRNYSSTGVLGTAPNYATGAFPIFRLADIYLMYAEAVLRGGTGGSTATALTYVNALRDRAEGSGGFTDLEITASQLTLPFILEERARELFWECTRRSDLVRFGMFTSSSYLWQWKGGAKEGQGVDSHLNIYPLPSSDLAANPNLKQNPGY